MYYVFGSQRLFSIPAIAKFPLPMFCLHNKHKWQSYYIKLRIDIEKMAEWLTYREQRNKMGWVCFPFSSPQSIPKWSKWTFFFEYLSQGKLIFLFPSPPSYLNKGSEQKWKVLFETERLSQLNIYSNNSKVARNNGFVFHYTTLCPL